MNRVEIQIESEERVRYSISSTTIQRGIIWTFVNILSWSIIPFINRQYTDFNIYHMLLHLNNIQFMIFMLVTTIMFVYSHVYRSIRTKKQMLIFYICPLLLSLHFSVLQHISFIRPIILKESQFDLHDTTYLIEISVIVLFLISILIYQLYYVSDRFKYMVFSMLPVVIIHFILFYGGSDNFHIHHYMVGMYMYAISYVNKRFSWITQMLGMGVFIDGTSNNAFDPLYDKN